MLHHIISTLGIDFHSGCSHIGHSNIILVEVFVYKNFNRTPVSSCCIGDHLQQSNTHGFGSKRFRKRTVPSWQSGPHLKCFTSPKQSGKLGVAKWTWWSPPKSEICWLLSKELLDKSAYDLSSWYHIVLHHITSYWHFITVYYSILLYITLHFITLYDIILHCSTFSYVIPLYYIILLFLSHQTTLALPQKEYQIYRSVWAIHSAAPSPLEGDFF